MDTVKTITRFPRGIITLPPSKSLSHRAILCAALAQGDSRIANIQLSEDIAATLSCAQALGASVSRTEDGLCIRGGFQGGKGIVLDCRESGSTLRFLLPIAALLSEEIRFVGQGRLMQRPLAPYEDNFARAGVAFAKTNTGLTVKGPLRSGDFSLPGDISSQFITGLLFALPLLPGDSRITVTSPLESKGYVDMTLDVLAHFGISITHDCYQAFHIPGRQRYAPAAYRVEGDYSQTAFFLGAAALGADVWCAGLRADSVQGDRAILDILLRMGASLHYAPDGTLRASSKRLYAVTVDVSHIPDLVPPVAALCCLAQGTSRIVNAGRLRIKESDRLHALAEELSALGACITEHADSLEITGAPMLKGGRTDAHNDHRIAMAVALAAVRCKEPVTLTGWQSVAKSYPSFWEDFEKEGRASL